MLYVVAATCLTHSQTPRPADPQKCALSGKITNKPAHVFSIGLKYLEKKPLDLYDGYFAQISSDGTFVFEDVAPGNTGSSPTPMISFPPNTAPRRPANPARPSICDRANIVETSRSRSLPSA
jgi:hypothetical protein